MRWAKIANRAELASASAILFAIALFFFVEPNAYAQSNSINFKFDSSTLSIERRYVPRQPTYRKFSKEEWRFAQVYQLRETEKFGLDSNVAQLAELDLCKDSFRGAVIVFQRTLKRKENPSDKWFIRVPIEGKNFDRLEWSSEFREKVQGYELEKVQRYEFKSGKLRDHRGFQQRFSVVASMPDKRLPETLIMNMAVAEDILLEVKFSPAACFLSYAEQIAEGFQNFIKSRIQ